MDLSSLCATGGKSTQVDVGGDDLGTEETKKRRSTYVDEGGGSGIKKGEGGGDRRRSSNGEGGGDRQPWRSVKEAAVGAWGFQIRWSPTTWRPDLAPTTSRRPPKPLLELRDQEDPSEISRIRQGREGRRGGAGAVDGGRGGGRGPTTTTVSTARGSAAVDASASAHANRPSSPPTMEPAMEATSLGPNAVRPSAGAWATRPDLVVGGRGKEAAVTGGLGEGRAGLLAEEERREWRRREGVRGREKRRGLFT
uniref:Uncharacterized protein n=1 Tax=Oryza nivara TaxID=4536 RepID=A0A0E0J4G3_ORYNI